MLQVDEFAVMGLRRGAAEALACAHAIPRSRLKGVTLVGGVGSTHWEGAPSEPGPISPFSSWFVQYAPFVPELSLRLVRIILNESVSWFKKREHFSERDCPPDRSGD